MEGTGRTITAHELWERMEGEWDFVLVDVRGNEAYDREHIKGAISIPLYEIDKRHRELGTRREIVVYCGSTACEKSPQAAERLRELGYDVIGYEAGFKGWKEAGYPTEITV